VTENASLHTTAESMGIVSSRFSDFDELIAHEVLLVIS
jgi:hypothetical protein